ncbi:MAG: hypothetical protein MK211_13325 [Flavobacteriales bacterium]|jgi:hypothetical protein|nr:hypothetical protein [Flavobacteriales bacterium]
MNRITNRQKAIDLAIWRNQNHRYDDNYGVVLGNKRDYIDCERDDLSFENREFESFPKDYVSWTMNI